MLNTKKFLLALVAITLCLSCISAIPTAESNDENSIDGRNTTVLQNAACTGLCTAYNLAKGIGIGADAALQAAQSQNCVCGGASVAFSVGLVLMSIGKFLF